MSYGQEELVIVRIEQNVAKPRSTAGLESWHENEQAWHLCWDVREQAWLDDEIVAGIVGPARLSVRTVGSEQEQRGDLDCSSRGSASGNNNVGDEGPELD